MTLTEHAATVGKPELQPRARLDGGGLVETRTAYIPESASGEDGARPSRTEKVG
jgi:hypothetical protein